MPGLRRLSAEELTELEPHCRGIAALHSPATGIVDFADVARQVGRDLESEGTPVVTGCGVTSVGQAPGRVTLQHERGETRARFAVFCAGAGSDRLAVAANASPDPRIVPFRGAYLYLRPERRELVRSLIYPVPDPSLPFLGVHLSRHIDGEVSLGPTALLAPRAARDLTWPGTWRMARRWWRTGVTELQHALSRRALAAAAAEYVPGIDRSDFNGGFAGIRAQAVARDGGLVDDFVVSETERALHVRNAPSPGGDLLVRPGPADRRPHRRPGCRMKAVETAPASPWCGARAGFSRRRFERRSSRRWASGGSGQSLALGTWGRARHALSSPDMAKLDPLRPRCGPRRGRRHPARTRPAFGRMGGLPRSTTSQHRQLYVPDGFAHGFCVLSELADVVYKVSSYYDPAAESGFRFNDPDVAIDWPTDVELKVSERDREAPLLSELGLGG